MFFYEVISLHEHKITSYLDVDSRPCISCIVVCQAFIFSCLRSRFTLGDLKYFRGVGHGRNGGFLAVS